jgi:hypothetical protein
MQVNVGVIIGKNIVDIIKKRTYWVDGQGKPRITIIYMKGYIFFI